MKKVLTLLSLFILLFSSCSKDPREYHGVKFYSSYDVKTLPLVAIEDNSSGYANGYYLVCVGNDQSGKALKYRALVKFPDNTMKLIEFKPDHIFIKYGNKTSITTAMASYLYNNWWHYEVIIEIPKECVKFENVLDGK